MEKPKKTTAKKGAAEDPRAARLSALNQAMESIEKSFGRGAVMRLGDDAVEDVDVIPSGSIGLNYALGVGGYPRGRIIEIYGPESSGKTTLAIHAIAEVQKQGGIAAIIDAEHAFDRFYAEKLGVEAEFVEIDWDTKIMELDAGNIDVVWNGMTLTDEVKAAMECTKPYCNNAQVIVVPAE